ncbi:SulP family inorganic anion transporter [Streptomyces sp. NBC_00825]|uniref:SulP family inorganic anion transporter n=1 Tax=unclassified Streptomyces TaxID=2593676 RepID=UPI00225BA2A9|nr:MULTISPECIES: SulP family inorganic anion transporter [unclassified Streptomyces]WTB55131.1 SulP family inorganic anion transporter [Streptomyces sp. NBC_00826]WTH91984.1 SulP family inorganic anion transporter [Streptomyces sp. NBC_00825]WTI00712.1 SulP family inorganic anion transporter [Streptomyces sp. NBC_00822]MCX4866232.1 SulP family inorganic anion transporter [Streptomyces sp. NBC_00906]MCX4897470.1 SulP family inorganic anion transporter [Streptomyces sp. NBC_00892]
MSACVPTRHNRTSRSSRPPRASGVKRPHSPPPPRGGRFRIAGADLSASITVFLLAVPMSLGLAVAMDAPLEAGLISAAIGGIVAGLLGGTPLQVSGPSAGLTVVTAELIQIYGWRTTCAITIGAGLLQILLGSLRAARSALAVSPAIVHGTLAGIGVAIALAQLHIVLGGSPQSSAVANALALPDQLGRVSPAAPLIGTLTITVLILWPRIPGRVGRSVRRIPAALAAVVTATAVAAIVAPGIARVDLPSWRSHALPEMPHGPVLALATAVFTVMLVASLESLLAAVAVDKLSADRAAGQTAARPGASSAPPPTSATPALALPSGTSAPAPSLALPARRSDLDRELRAQGIANTLSGLVGGLAVSGGAVRSSANVRAGATGRASTVLHGVWVLLATGLLVTVLEWIPLAALAALVMMVGIQMVSFAHIRNVHKHREFLVYGATITGVVLFGVLKGVAIGIAVAVTVALHRLARTRITVTDQGGRHLVVVRGQLTFLAVPRLSRTLGQLPQGGDAVVELDGFFMDHAAYEAIQGWSTAQTAHGGRVVFTGRSGGRIAEPASAAHSCCRPWTPWRNHHCHDEPGRAPETSHDLAPGPGLGKRSTGTGRTRRAANTGSTAHISPTDRDANCDANRPADHPADRPASHDASHDMTIDSPGNAPTPAPAPEAPRLAGGNRLISGLSSFQRNTAPLVRDELARLAVEGQRPSQLFITCADSRLVTSMITASGPGDLFTVRNIGNLVPLPDAESGDHSVGAAIEYAVDVLKVESITVCGHSGCGAMQALLGGEPDRDSPPTSLWRWLRHGLPSLERMASRHHAWARISGRLPTDALEQLCLTNVVQQLDHLRAHESVARRLAEGTIRLHGMYFHVGEAQAYLLTEGASSGLELDEVFDRVDPGDAPGSGELERTGV